MDFWLKPENKDSYYYLHTNQQNYMQVFEKLSNYLHILNEKYKIIFCAQPACFDWMFLKCYYELAKKNSNKTNFYEIGFKCECISTLWIYYKKKNKLSAKKSNELLNQLSPCNKNELHFAINDAKIQGIFYIKLMELLIE